MPIPVPAPAAIPVVAKPVQPEPPKPPTAHVAPPEMTLLRAMDLLAEPASRPVVSTLSSLGGADPQPAVARSSDTVSSYAFPLIDALDLPGGFPLRRAAAPPRVAAPPVPRALPAVLAAAEVAAPLPELFRLLAAGPAATDDALAALRHPPRAAGS
ncbi:hypothetical protein [Falsiroseomonas sp. CW058]|uniref:hypothetical protein n=1 Tax=Falsiroseomonas sp. CW058 TaxID=3388664 RepID=UPI003D311F39